MNMEGIQYIAFKLSPLCRRRLAGLERRMFSGRYQKVYCDHVTLAYGPGQVEAFDKSLLGRTAAFESWNIIADDRCAALEVDRNDFLSIGVNNEYPHVTMACAAGTKPVYSNELIRGYYADEGAAEVILLDRPFRLVGRVEPVMSRPGV